MVLTYCSYYFSFRMTYFSLKWLLQKKLNHAFTSFVKDLGGSPLTSDGIGVSSLLDTSLSLVIPDKGEAMPPGILYISPVALKLQRWWGGSSLAIAEHLATQVQRSMMANSDTTVAYDVKLAVKVHAQPSGWLDWHITPSGLTPWLETVLDWTSLDMDNGAIALSQAQRDLALVQPRLQDGRIARLRLSPLMILQHSHARCCAALRWAEYSEILKLEPATYRLIAPRPLPWLTADGQWHWVSPQEVAVFYAVLNALDSWIGEDPPLRQWQTAIALSTAIYHFWGEYSLIAPVSDHRLAQLGLIRLAQVSLRFFLQHQLGVAALPYL